jgi:hypothetical protein
VVATASEPSEVLESNAFRGMVASTWLRNGLLVELQPPDSPVRFGEVAVSACGHLAVSSNCCCSWTLAKMRNGKAAMIQDIRQRRSSGCTCRWKHAALLPVC